jgi:hypothetical protein
MSELLSQLGLAGAIIAATIVLLREIRKQSASRYRSYREDEDEYGNGRRHKPTTVKPPSNGRVQALEDKTDAKMERVEDKIQAQGVQLDCLSREQSETRAVVERLNVQQERQGGKLDTILDIVRRR